MKRFLTVATTIILLITCSAVADDIVLCRPTDDSVTVNLLPVQDGNAYFEYGTASGVYTDQTSTHSATAGEPVEVVIDSLASNTRYYYRTRFQETGQTEWTAGDEHSFHTHRPPGNTFTFTIISDSHLEMMGSETRYNNATLNVAADNPDFHLDLGDAFIMNDVLTQAAANDVYLTQRPYFGNFSHSAPVFLAIGNHENEEGWNFDDTPSEALMSIIARKQYYPSPVTDGFYSGNDDTLAAIGGDELREDYYAWEWGNALFIVIDPFHYTMNLPYEPGRQERALMTISMGTNGVGPWDSNNSTGSNRPLKTVTPNSSSSFPIK